HMAGLFDTFTVAKRGLSVQQGNINTTSHNLANSQTAGYSRQRAVVETTRPFGGMSKFDSCSVGQVGTGAEITSIQRIRDYFIDYQVRSESGTSGYYTQRNET
ncbi:Flagellar hook-associated protein FlgK, partial [human gut metagenome]